MVFIPDVTSLKKVSSIYIDAEIIKQTGNQIFNYPGPITPEFVQIRTAFTNSLEAVIQDAQNLKNMLSEANGA